MSLPTLVRQTFKTSRLAEFCSQKELVNQTGHEVADWPLVIIKELLENALDGCEESGIAPKIEIIKASWSTGAMTSSVCQIGRCTIRLGI
jgi:DNA topoisomerase VI subunit B